MDPPLGEAPALSAPLELVVVPARRDRLQARSGSACSTVKYERAVARPASGAKSMITFVVTCLVRGVPSS